VRTRIIHTPSKPRVGVSILIVEQALTNFTPIFENIRVDDAATAKKRAASLQVSTRLSLSNIAGDEPCLISSSTFEGSEDILANPFWTVDFEKMNKRAVDANITR
jgi:hypothetical protein